MRQHGAVWPRTPIHPGGTVVSFGEHIPAEAYRDLMLRPRVATDYDEGARGAPGQRQYDAANHLSARGRHANRQAAYIGPHRARKPWGRRT